jgi:hypothetical protein
LTASITTAITMPRDSRSDRRVLAVMPSPS